MGKPSVSMLNILYNKHSVHEVIKKQYQEFSGNQYYGMYSSISGKPILTIRDLDLVQHILSKVANSRMFII